MNTILLAFWAETAAEARQQARAWAESERNVETYRVIKTWRDPERPWWVVRVRLAFRQAPLELGL